MAENCNIAILVLRVKLIRARMILLLLFYHISSVLSSLLCDFLLMALTSFDCWGDKCPNRCEVDATRCSCKAGNKCLAHEAAYWAGCGQIWQVKGSDKFYCMECTRKNEGYEAKAEVKATRQFTKWKRDMVCQDSRKHAGLEVVMIHYLVRLAIHWTKLMC